MNFPQKNETNHNPAPDRMSSIKFGNLNFLYEMGFQQRKNKEGLAMNQTFSY